MTKNETRNNPVRDIQIFFMIELPKIPFAILVLDAKNCGANVCIDTYF